jgi:hypothetical protein
MTRRWLCTSGPFRPLYKMIISHLFIEEEQILFTGGIFPPRIRDRALKIMHNTSYRPNVPWKGLAPKLKVFWPLSQGGVDFAVNYTPLLLPAISPGIPATSRPFVNLTAWQARVACYDFKGRARDPGQSHKQAKPRICAKERVSRWTGGMRSKSSVVFPV